MKTKTLVNTLTSLRLIPSVQDDFGGEVLPEAILVKNIMEELQSGADTLFRMASLMQEDRRTFEDDQEMSDELRDKLQRFKTLLNMLKSSIPSQRFSRLDQQDCYDADSEVFDDMTSAKRRLKRRDKMKSSTSNKGERFQGHLQAESGRESVEQAFILISREILLLTQNKRSAAEMLRRFLKSDSEGSLDGNEEESSSDQDFLKTLDQLDNHIVIRIMIPQTNHVQEVETLCASIALKQKYEKIVNRLKSTLEEIETNCSECIGQKHLEKAELEESIRVIREQSMQAIKDHLEYVGSRVKVVAWNSHARQSRTLEQIGELKKELEEAMDEHVEAETQMRRENLKLESELEEMIARYDAEMFQKFEAMEKIGKEYAEEKIELSKLLDELSVVEGEMNVLLEENRLEERLMIEAELTKIRRIVAAKTIQKAWRAHKTRMLLKSKKKKKKRTIVHS